MSEIKKSNQNFLRIKVVVYLRVKIKNCTLLIHINVTDIYNLILHIQDLLK